MKYLEQYLEEKMKIKVLSDLGIVDCSQGDDVGVSLVIDGFDTGIEVWYVDYDMWLEKKLEENSKKLEFNIVKTNIV
jgi:hypothetical protein